MFTKRNSSLANTAAKRFRIDAVSTPMLDQFMKGNGNTVLCAKENFKIKETLEDTLKTSTKETTHFDAINVVKDFLIGLQ